MSERTLVTGFGPFLQVKDNPSAILAASLNRNHRVIEVSYAAAEAFIGQLDGTTFDRLLLMGVAEGRSHLCLELIAQNGYSTSAGVDGISRSGEIEPGGPPFLTSTLFDEQRLVGLMSRHPQLRTSRDAGTYLCNFIYHRALAACPNKRVGFLHIPSFDVVQPRDQVRIVADLLEELEADS